MIDAVSVSLDDPNLLIVALADAAGATLTVILPRRELRSVLSWRDLLSI